MKRAFLATAATVMGLALAACNPVAAVYDDKHLETPTNTITVPAQGYYDGKWVYTTLEPQGEIVDLTDDGQTGWVVCQHYRPNWVLYDKATVVSTNVIHMYADLLCMEEGYQIKAGQPPQDLQIQSVYRSNEPSETLGAYLNRE